jgi:NAD kinase
LFTQFEGDEKKDPGLDLRMRLKISVEGNATQKVYVGG